MDHDITSLKTLVDEVKKEIADSSSLTHLDQIRVKYLGKKGQLTDMLKNLSQLSAEERPKAGQAVNQAKQALQVAIQAQNDAIKQIELNQKLEKEKIDVTLPGRGLPVGSVHPVTRVFERVERLFLSKGFHVEEGPEIEDEEHNFDMLNIPKHHPARAMHDTFYLIREMGEQPSLLRTHTSPVQIRAMKKLAPPLRVITPGRVYRCDWDQTHTPMFHQLEGLLIDEDCTFAHLRGVLEDFINNFFEKELAFRFRPSYFPFTEPSAEMDMSCLICDGKGCRTCGNNGWLEILGCGMVHPNVLENVGIDAEKYTGFAFGIGLDRLAMLRYQIDDLRLMFENDMRFLEQF